MQRSELRVAILIVAGALLLAACNALQVLQPPDDNAIATEIQAKLFADSVLKTRDIHVTSQKGVVTLTGTVGTELERAAVERLAGQVSGVKSVTNQLTVSPPPAATAPAPETPTATAASTPPPAPPEPSPTTRHRERASTSRVSENAAPASTPAPASTAAYNEPPASAAPAPATAATAAPAPAAAPVPPSPPEPTRITIPAGTVVTVRMIDGIDSSRNRAGEEFVAAVDAPIVVGNQVVASRGSDARVRLAEARSAGRMTGRSELQLELVSLSVGGNTYTVQSGFYEQHGASRGTRTAETVGGGAALGALIGAIAGRGKGAAIGAAVGAGAGTAVQASTHGQQVKVPSETKLDFTLKSPVTVTM